MDPLDDTIAAIASAPGGSVRGVIRLSGPRVVACLRRCFQPCAPLEWSEVERPTCRPGHLSADLPVGPLPCDLYLWPTGRSYTRQPSAELHTFGSPPLLDAALRTLCRRGARLAQPGEFTLRAFLAGRIDLTQAEAVLGVIEAEDSAALRVALHQLAGDVSRPLTSLRSEVLDLLADLEAGLDFADEDIAQVSAEQIGQRLRHLERTAAKLLDRVDRRGQSAERSTVVLRGWPNVGKSSLFNALLGDDAALVSPQPGTTRDYVTRAFQWQNVRGTLIDTAGVEPDAPDDSLEARVRRLTEQQTGGADLELVCLDASRSLLAGERRLLRSVPARQRLVVWTKCDVAERGIDPDVSAVRTSSRTRAGIEELRALVASRLSPTAVRSERFVASTAERCRQSLRTATESLRRARRLASGESGEELIAVELRETLDQLGRIIGAVYTDDLLDRIFSRFCIGK